MHASNRETIYSAGSGDWTQARLITVSGSARTVPMSHRDKLMLLENVLSVSYFQQLVVWWNSVSLITAESSVQISDNIHVPNDASSLLVWQWITSLTQRPIIVLQRITSLIQWPITVFIQTSNSQAAACIGGCTSVASIYKNMPSISAITLIIILIIFFTQQRVETDRPRK